MMVLLSFLGCTRKKQENDKFITKVYLFSLAQRATCNQIKRKRVERVGAPGHYGYYNLIFSSADNTHHLSFMVLILVSKRMKQWRNNFLVFCYLNWHAFTPDFKLELLLIPEMHNFNDTDKCVRTMCFRFRIHSLCFMPDALSSSIHWTLSKHKFDFAGEKQKMPENRWAGQFVWWRTKKNKSKPIGLGN